jgi:predicted esterase
VVRRSNPKKGCKDLIVHFSITFTKQHERQSSFNSPECHHQCGGSSHALGKEGLQP